MASVTTSTGIFSGLDTASIISSLMAVEQRPLQSLGVKKSGYQAELSVFGKLKSSLATLSTAAGALKDITTQTMKASSSDTSVFSATATSSAAAGTYSIQVSQLATAQSIYSSTFASETSEVADLSGVTTQKLKIQVGSATAQEITIDATNNSLSGIRDAINAADAGVTASTINAGFEISGANNTIVFNDGSSRTATLTAGTYSGDALSAEIKRALEAANGGADTYTVSYDNTTHKFSISNDSANSNAVDILWEDPTTTAAALLGFSASDHASIAVGASAAGDSAVGGYRLILTSSVTGAANHIKISVDEDNNGTYSGTGTETDTSGLSRLAFDASYNSNGALAGGVANMSQTAAALSATLVVNGLSVSRDSNTVSDLISGVTLNLLSKSTTTTPTLTISKDTQSIIDDVKDFVNAYNGASGLIRSVTTSSPTSRALLSGDGAVTSMLTSLRNAITTTFGDYAPATLGITHTKDGVLQVDSTVLENFLKDDLSGVVTSLNKMGKVFDDNVSFFVNTSIPSRTDGLNQSIKRIDESVASLQRRLTLTQQHLTRRFSDLEALIGNLQTSGTSLTQQLQGLN